jgi:hypothetical protein
MSGSGTNTHSKRMINSWATMDVLRTMDCRMNAQGIMTCEPRMASPECMRSGLWSRNDGVERRDWEEQCNGC